jgi:hypothetical protein
MIAFITSMLSGVFVGLLLALLTFPALVSLGTGIVLFLVSFGVLQRYQWRQWKRLEHKLKFVLPSTSVKDNESSRPNEAACRAGPGER